MATISPTGRERRSFLAGLAALAALLPLRAGAATDAARKIRELYDRDLSFSDLAQELSGERIALEGYMAPPLKAESRFFVLTARPMAVCPFCESEAEWPNDIIAVHTRRIIEVVPFNVPILSFGILELGTYTDPQTGFVSRVRLVQSHYERA